MLISAQDSKDDEPIEPNLNILQTNLIGVMYTAKLAIHYLSRNGEGNDRVLIMTASLAGYLDQPGSPQYCASKCTSNSWVGGSLETHGSHVEIHLSLRLPTLV